MHIYRFIPTYICVVWPEERQSEESEQYTHGTDDCPCRNNVCIRSRVGLVGEARQDLDSRAEGPTVGEKRRTRWPELGRIGFRGFIESSSTAKMK